MFKAVNVFIGIVGLSLSLTMSAHAGLDNGVCSKAVVVYLDVSGSMDQERNKATSIKTGKRVNLMQAMGELFEKLFSHEAGIVGPEDYFELKGFYSKVAPLTSQNTIFREVQEEVLRKSLELQSKSFSSRDRSYFISQLGSKTSFAEVLADMEATSRRLNRAGSPYRQIVYIILSDCLDDAGSPQRLKDSFKNNSVYSFDDRQKSRTKVLLFGLPNALLGKEGEINVQNDFKRYLGASFFPCGKEFDTGSVIKSIRENTLPSIEVLRIGEPVPADNAEEIRIPILFSNDSCTDLCLKTISWTINSAPDAKGRRFEIRDIEVPDTDFILSSRNDAGSIKEYMLNLPVFLPEGSVEISVRPETIRGGYGQEVRLSKIIRPYILLRNTSVHFSPTKDRLILRTMLVNKFARDLTFESLQADIFRVPSTGGEVEYILQNHIFTVPDEQIVLSAGSPENRYRYIEFDVEIPASKPGDYVAEVYARDAAGNTGGNRVKVHSLLKPSVFIEEISTVSGKNDGDLEMHISLGNSCGEPVLVDSVKFAEVSKDDSAAMDHGWDWKGVNSRIFSLAEPITVLPGGHGVVSVPVDKGKLDISEGGGVVVQAMSLRSGGESPIYFHVLPLDNKSPLLGLILVAAALIMGVSFYRSNNKK